MKILAIDDIECQLAALAEMLRVLIPGCEVATAISGKAGLELARTFQPDTIILDIVMPGMDGFEVCQALKSDPATRHIPVIFLTGAAADSASHIRALKIGGDVFLTNPIKAGELISQVRAMVRIKHAEDELRAENISTKGLLRETREQQAAILHTMKDGFFVLDLQGRLLDVNAAAGQMTGYSRAELLRLSLADLEADESPEEIAGQIGKIKQAGAALFQRRHRCKDGRLIHVEVSANYLPNSHERLFAFIRDITERKLAEEELRVSRQRFALHVQQTPLGVIEFDLEGRVREWNPAAAAIFGFSPAEAVGQHWTFLTPEAEWKQLDGVWESIITQTGGRRSTNRNRTKPGRSIICEWFNTPLVDAAGQTIGVASLVLDITEHREAEAALQEREEQYRKVVESSPDGIFILRENRFVLLNPAALEIFGAGRQEELLGRDVFNFIHPDFHDLIRARIVQTTQQEAALPLLEQKLLRLDGSIVEVEATSTRFQIQGRPALLVEVRDITQRKQAEAALQSSEARYRSIFESSQDAIMTLEPPAWRFTTGNPATVRMFGAKDETEFISHGPWELSPERQPDGRASAGKAREMIETAMREGSHSFEWTHRRIGGEDFPATVLLSRVQSGGKTFLQATVRDITKRKQAEAALRLESAALEATANAIVITDREGTIEWVNAAFTTFTGYTAAEAIGKNPRQLIKSGKHKPAFYKNLWNTILAGKVWQGELVNRRKDGSLYTDEMTITPLKDERGEITHFIAVKQDITQRKLLEAQFRQSQKMEAFGQLAGGVAHDFNNVLTVIQGNAALLRMDVAATDKQEALQQIDLATTRAAELVRQLLTFSRRQVMHVRSVNLNEAVTGVGKMLQRLIGENIALRIQLLPGGAPVQADPGMIEQVLLNLAVNARDAMPKGGQLGVVLENLTLDETTAARHHLARPGRFVRLTIRDDGKGIAPEVLPHIFEPFFTTKDVGKGTGLGLATVHGIVEQHHGWIEVESAVGRGTAFHIYLPRLEGMPPIKTGEEPVPQVCGGGETILLVEDDAALRTLAAHALEYYGYRVIAAASGLAALELWRLHRNTVALLLTDIIMPDGVSGSELAVQLRADQPGLKVLYMSGYPGEVAGRGLDLRPGKNFLQKPFTPADIGQIVRDCLDGPQK